MSIKTFVVLALLTFNSLHAAAPVAVLTAGPDVKMNGKPIQTSGAPNWPVAPSDEILTGSSGAVLSLSDGARVTLAPNTKVAFKKCDACIVQLFQGSATYEKPAGSKLEICALGQPVRPAAGTSGSVSIEPEGKVMVKVAGKEQVTSRGTCACKAGAPWGATGSHNKVIITAVGSAAAVAAGTVALTRGSEASAR